MRLYLRAASTTRRPSSTRWLSGFSMYASLPAWQAQTAISECQWFGVATEIASSSLSSRASRMSVTHFGATPYFAVIGLLRDAHRLLSGSMRYVIWTPGSLRYWPMWPFPWPLMPQTPMRMASLAPRTRPDDLVPAMVTAAADARVVLKKSRRVGWVMGEG